MDVQVPDLQLGPAARFANDSQLFFPVAALLESRVPDESKGALQVCNSSTRRLLSHTAILHARKPSKPSRYTNLDATYLSLLQVAAKLLQARCGADMLS